MRRRALLLAIGAALLALPLMSRAQAPAKLVRVGIVSGQPRTEPLWTAFDQRLRELGYREGENLTIEYLDAHGETRLIREAMQELVRRKVDIIVASGNEIVLRSALAATTTLPIVMVAIDYDPVERGYVKTLAHPGGNITGLFFQQVELAAKRLELLHQAFPDLHGATVFWDAASADQWHALERAGAALNLRLVGVEMREQPYDYEQALSAAPTAARGVLVQMTSSIFFRDRAHIADFELRHRIPAIFAFREFTAAGGLMSYGPSITGMYRRAGEYVARIAGGAKPSELPVEQPTTFELVINLKTAKALGIDLPPTLLARADEVIE
ncbi:MAG TPA: ABC transporter substrate-binding protein [Stellaceae bacterium]|nr:ABC transporter substrate-binding protein [Stellaceae bacterium]